VAAARARACCRDKPRLISDGEKMALLFNIACCHSQLQDARSGLVALGGACARACARGRMWARQLAAVVCARRPGSVRAVNTAGPQQAHGGAVRAPQHMTPRCPSPPHPAPPPAPHSTARHATGCLEAGYTDYRQIRSDPDLEFLRADARFEVR
jgi:hypothetical protein